MPVTTLEQSVVNFTKWFNNNKHTFDMDLLNGLQKKQGKIEMFFLCFGLFFGGGSLLTTGWFDFNSFLGFGACVASFTVCFVGLYFNKCLSEEKWNNYFKDMPKSSLKIDFNCPLEESEKNIVLTVEYAKRLNFKETTIQSLINQTHKNGLFWSTLHSVLHQACCNQITGRVYSNVQGMSLQQQKQHVLKEKRLVSVEVEKDQVIQEKRTPKNKHWGI